MRETSSGAHLNDEISALQTPRPSFGSAATKPFKRTNEDACLAFESSQLTVLAVADGVGSSRDSNLASQLAIQSIQRHIETLNPDLPVDGFRLIDQIWDTLATNFKKYYEDRREHYLSF